MFDKLEGFNTVETYDFSVPKPTIREQVDALCAKVRQLEGELMDANPGDLEQARAHATNLELAIEQTWRPEVKALRAKNERLRAALTDLLELHEDEPDRPAVRVARETLWPS